MENITKSEFGQNCIRIIKGSVISFLSTIILLFLFAVLLTYSNVNEKFISPTIIIISAISILIGSSISTLKIRKNGLINGGIIAIIYISIIYLLSSTIGAGFSLNIRAIIMIISCIGVGMLGGIIGVNIK